MSERRLMFKQQFNSSTYNIRPLMQQVLLLDLALCSGNGCSCDKQQLPWIASQTALTYLLCASSHFPLRYDATSCCRAQHLITPEPGLSKWLTRQQDIREKQSTRYGMTDLLLSSHAYDQYGHLLATRSDSDFRVCKSLAGKSKQGHPVKVGRPEARGRSLQRRSAKVPSDTPIDNFTQTWILV